MMLGAIYQRICRSRALALVFVGGVVISALPSCEAESLSSVWVDAVEGAINAAIPTLFEAIRQDLAGEETIETIPTVLLDTLHGLSTMLA